MKNIEMGFCIVEVHNGSALLLMGLVILNLYLNFQENDKSKLFANEEFADLGAKNIKWSKMNCQIKIR